ncbi:hypothetical protein SAMN02927921_03670 [Sinomicrobium oceani]|uniref:Uncharacterized protein n=1 Tax=Sinomicrobium oceani TaxID=1150368 RepID=A0A1K1RKI3_9FLAO|nr:hypothetical protein [Sinomicrobium oceani]SFW72348.1 hypothetical protein SAMN02927921_03670 [Sinomicrobium oceani]
MKAQINTKETQTTAPAGNAALKNATDKKYVPNHLASRISELSVFSLLWG